MSSDQIYKDATHTAHEMLRCTCGRIIIQCRCIMPHKIVKLVAMGCDACKREHRGGSPVRLTTPTREEAV